MDIEPDSADLPEHQDHMAAWDPAPKEEMPAAPAPQQTFAAEDTPEQLGFDVQEGPAPLRYVGEIFKTYILAERGEEICIIDKHAAHERQLFEKLAANYGDVPAQLLLEPLVVELSAEEKTAPSPTLNCWKAPDWRSMTLAATACSCALCPRMWNRAVPRICWWSWPISSPRAAEMP